MGIGSIISGIGDVITGNWGGLAKDAASLLDSGADAYSAYASYKQQADINASQERMFGENLQWQGQSQQNAFAHDREMATAQMAFQDDQSRTQYQRAMADMQAGGLNPILAASRGGNAAMSGSAPTSSGSGGSPIPQLGNKVTAGLAGAASAASISNLSRQNELLAAQRDNVKADTLGKLELPEKIKADAAYSLAGASQSRELAHKVGFEVAEILARTTGLIPAEIRNMDARTILTEVQQALEKQRTLTERDRAALYRAETKLSGLEQAHLGLDLPRAAQESRMHQGVLGSALPYAHEIEKFGSSAAGAYRQLRGYRR